MLLEITRGSFTMVIKMRISNLIELSMTQMFSIAKLENLKKPSPDYLVKESQHILEVFIK